MIVSIIRNYQKTSGEFVFAGSSEWHGPDIVYIDHSSILSIDTVHRVLTKGASGRKPIIYGELLF